MFDFVLNNQKPLVFPDAQSPRDDGLIYDPALGTVHVGEYQYKWGRDRWVSHLNIFSLNITDQRYVLVPGDKMTGGLMMGYDVNNPILDPNDDKNRPDRRFIVKRYNLDANPKLPSDQIKLLKPHVLTGTQAINNRLKITEHAVVFDYNREPILTQQWYRLSIDYDEVDGAPVLPTEDDWKNATLVASNVTQYLLTEDDLNKYIRSVETYTDPSVLPNGASQVASIVDTQLIRINSN